MIEYAGRLIFSLREMCGHKCFFLVSIVFSMCSSMFQIMFFKGVPNSTTLLSLMVCPKFSPFCVYSWAQRGDPTCSCKNFYFEELQKFQFFCFLLNNDPIKMGPHLINRSNNHRHKCVWASPTIFLEIYGSGWGQREREKKRNGVVFLYNLHLRPLVDLMSLSIWSY
jgi:hypothetical protein